MIRTCNALLSRKAPLVLLLAMSLFLPEAAGRAAATYIVFDPSGSIATYGRSINANGDIAGTWEDPSYGNAIRGFLRTADGTITKFDPQGRFGADVRGINDNDWIVGDYPDGANTDGFIRAPNGTTTTFQAPNSNGYTVIMAINNKNAFTGTWESVGGQAHGFYVTPKGIFQNIDPEGSAWTSPTCINDSGSVAGDWFDGTNYHSFIRGGGSLISFDVPGTDPFFYSPHIASINSRGDVAGWYTTEYALYGFVRTAGGVYYTFSIPATYSHGMTTKDLVTGTLVVSGVHHGFIRKPGGAINKFDPKGSVGTDAFAVNNSSQITGGYIDKKDLTHGFLRTP